MTSTAALLRTAAFTAIVAAVVTSGTNAQTMADPRRPDLIIAQATPGQVESAQPGQPGPMRPGTMGQGMTGQSPMSQTPMGQGMTGQSMMGRGMMARGMAGMPMMGGRGHMMTVMFAIADTDGDGALSFEEITAVHKRIFDKIDANKDGKVTIEELQTFMRE